MVLEAVDESVSAGRVPTEMRPAWKEILGRAGELDAVVVWKVDRLARNVLDFLFAARLLSDLEVDLVATDDPVDLTTPTGKALAVMLSVVAELELEAIKDRLKASRKYLTQQGRRPGGRRPWAMQNLSNPNGPGKVLRPIPERAELLREAANRVLVGESLGSIARDWTARKVPTGLGGDQWYTGKIKQVLLNPHNVGATVYLGALVRNDDGTIRKDPDQAILDDLTFDRLRVAIGDRQQGARVPVRSLLKGLLICASCSEPLHPRPARDTYSCSRQHCSRPVSVMIDFADRLYVERWLSAFAQVRRAPDKAGLDEPHMAELRQAIQEASNEIADRPAVERYRHVLDVLRDLEGHLDHALSLEVSSNAQTVPVAAGRTWGELWADAGDDLEARHAVLAALGAKAIVLPGSRGGSKSVKETVARFKFPWP